MATAEVEPSVIRVILRDGQGPKVRLIKDSGWLPPETAPGL